MSSSNNNSRNQETTIIKSENPFFFYNRIAILSPIFAFFTNDIFEAIGILSHVSKDFRECVQHFANEMWMLIVSEIIRKNSCAISKTSVSGRLNDILDVKRFCRILGSERDQNRKLMSRFSSGSHNEKEENEVAVASSHHHQEEDFTFDHKDHIFNLRAWCIQALVRQGNFNISEAQMYSHGSALAIAVANADVKLTKFLLESARVDPNFHVPGISPPPLFIACSQLLDEIEQIVELLLDFGANPRLSSSVVSIGDNNGNGSPSNNTKIHLIDHAAVNTSVTVVQKLIHHPNFFTSEYTSVTQRTREMIKNSQLNILEKLIDLNRDRDKEMLELLIFGGGRADVNDGASLPITPPIIRACFRRNFIAFRLLMKTLDVERKFFVIDEDGNENDQNDDDQVHQSTKRKEILLAPLDLTVGFPNTANNRTILFFICEGDNPWMYHTAAENDQLKRYVLSRRVFFADDDKEEEEAWFNNRYKNEKVSMKKTRKLKQSKSFGRNNNDNDDDENNRESQENKHLDSLVVTVTEDELAAKMASMLLSAMKKHDVFKKMLLEDAKLLESIMQKNNKDDAKTEEQEQEDPATILLKQYIDQAETNSNLTPLGKCCVNCYPKTTKVLLEWGADMHKAFAVSGNNNTNNNNNNNYYTTVITPVQVAAYKPNQLSKKSERWRLKDECVKILYGWALKKV